MSSSLLRVFDLGAEEISAWLGRPEQMAYFYVHHTDILEPYWESRIDKYLLSKLKQAFAEKRRLRLIFASRCQTSFDTVLVLTIDRRLGRVDRELSSEELLRDMWEFAPIKTADLKSAFSPDQPKHVDTREMVEIVKQLTLLPGRFAYQYYFCKRQREIEQSLGYSRRFTSLVTWFSPVLEPETQILLKQSLQSLWKHEQWMKRKVDLAEAEQALSDAHVTCTQWDYDPDDWDSPNDPGPMTERCEWVDEDGNRIANAYFYADYREEFKDVQHVHLRVFGTCFYGKEAEDLVVHYKSITVHDKRSLKKEE